MSLSSILEKWDSILYNIYNIYSYVVYLFKYYTIKRIVSSGRVLKDKHKGGRCFIVLNGPSINNYDLSKLKDEYVFVSNYFFRSPLCKLISPNYYCWLDAKVFFSKDCQNLMSELKDSCPNAVLLLNYKAYAKLGEKECIHYCYAKHIPNTFSIQNRIDGIFSNFSTVAFFCIAAAIYMGFKDIYILGLDFEPGGFKHFANLGKGSECVRPESKNTKDDVCGLHWGYVKAQYESYALANFAKRKGVHVINLNHKSCIRAFQFDNYENVIKRDK